MKLSDVLKWDKIRYTKVWNKKYYSIVSVLDQLEVSTRLRKYWYDAKKKIEKKDKKILEWIKDLKVEASDWKQRVLDGATRADLEKILKALPSKKVKVLFETKKDSKKKKDDLKKVKKTIKKTTKKAVEKEVKNETKKMVSSKKTNKKKVEKKSDKLKKETKKAVKKEVKKITKELDEEKILKKAKGNKKNVKKVVKKEVKKKLKKEVKKKKCWIICNIVKIFS